MLPRLVKAAESDVLVARLAVAKTLLLSLLSATLPSYLLWGHSVLRLNAIFTFVVSFAV